MRRRYDDDDVDSFQRINRRARRRREAPPPPAVQVSTYFFSDHGPEPVPSWVITEDAAEQHERGLMKTGKEADVFLVERVLGRRVNLLAAKRYRSREHRDFENDAVYRERLRSGSRRVDLAVGQGTRRGREFRAQMWADHEFALLGRLWAAGLAVPYPVQQRGTELMLEYIGDEDYAAPRLSDADLGDSRRTLTSMADQAVALVRGFVDNGVVHGDLSPYNVLVHDGRLVAIDFPQAVDPLDADGTDFLHRDVDNLIGWFARKGAPVDPDKLFADLVARLFR